MPDPTPITDPIAPDARVAELETAVAALTRRAEVAEQERDALARRVAELTDDRASAHDRVTELLGAFPSVGDALRHQDSDPAPDARYTETESRLARAMWLAEVTRNGGDPWEALEVPQRHVVMACARAFLGRPAGRYGRGPEMVRALLGV
jgi:hypothetical protein